MADPLGLIGRGGAFVPPGRPHGLTGRPAPGAGVPSSRAAGAPSFREVFEREIAQVNELQDDAKRAAEDYAVGRRDDVEGVIIAAQKADTAFRMLLQIRNKVMDAYEEVKQVRV
jgi:flagellar hook-basal body complex protein FliE